jgi:hypothetical protein
LIIENCKLQIERVKQYTRYPSFFRLD